VRRRGLPRPAALVALIAPLLAAMLDEVESRTRTLEARGIGLAGRRMARPATPDDPRQRALRRALVGVAALILLASRWPR
jgi:hypothetical protein